MDINNLVRKRLEGKDKIEIVKKMGYQSPKRGVESLDYFLSKGSLDFLMQGMYDFKYTADQFFEKLCEVLEIDKKLTEEARQEIKKIVAEKRAYEYAYIYVNTNFKRTSEPIFVLAFMESTRRIRLNADDFLLKSDEEVLKEISKIVKNHYKETGGELFIWGKIKNYVYDHKDGKSYIFDTDGNLINEKVLETMAILSVK